ncbi:MAG: NAD-dependent epimerase/dehydratase family protein [Alphaproteobacteria bacterium]
MGRHVLVTGATGFVATALCEVLLQRSFTVSGATRRPDKLPVGVRPRRIGDIGPTTDWVDALFTVDSVVHLAGRGHETLEGGKETLAEYRRLNVEGTRHLAETAAAEGVRRFILVSTVTVHGETSKRPLSETDPVAPVTPFAISRWEAEQTLHDIAARTPMTFTVLRVPMVYGPQVRGPFLELMKACAGAETFPIGGLRNQRSFLFSANLAHAIRLALIHPKAAGKTYVLRDDEDLSTPQMVERLGSALGGFPRITPLPSRLLGVAAKLRGRAAPTDGLNETLAVDDDTMRYQLDWEPPYSLEEGLAATVAWYRKISRSSER